jgi:hypothetical protein
MASDEERAGAGGAASLRVDPPPGSRPSTGVLFPKLRRYCPSPGLPPSTGGCNEEAAEGGRRPGVGGGKNGGGWGGTMGGCILVLTGGPLLVVSMEESYKGRWMRKNEI